MPFSKWIIDCEKISSPPPLLCLGLISQKVAALALQQPPLPLLPLLPLLTPTFLCWVSLSPLGTLSPTLSLMTAPFIHWHDLLAPSVLGTLSTEHPLVTVSSLDWAPSPLNTLWVEPLSLLSCCNCCHCYCYCHWCHSATTHLISVGGLVQTCFKDCYQTVPDTPSWKRPLTSHPSSINS